MAFSESAGWTTVSIDKDADVDILSIHGLLDFHYEQYVVVGGTLYRCAEAHISISGYQADHGDLLPTDAVKSVADKLLCELKTLDLPSNSARPIIFICHGLGGLVAQEALLSAKLQRTLSSVTQRTYGMVFIQTPHATDRSGWVAEARRAISETKWRTARWKERQWSAIAGGFADITKAFQQVSMGYKLVYFSNENMAEHSESTTFHPNCLGSSWLTAWPEQFFLGHGNYYAIAESDAQTMPKGRIGELVASLTRAAVLQQWSYNAHLESERSLLRICASQRLPGTCDWLFGHSNYRAWLSPNGPACLWIHGIAGAGKTILSSSVLKELDKNDTRDTVVLSYFFDGVAGHGHSMQDLVAMIACKFAKYQRQPAPEPILSCLRDGLYQSRSTMSPASLKLSFRRLLAGVDPQIQVILLVDGLDSYEWIKGMVIDEITLANLDRDRLRHFKCCISSRTPLNAELYSDQVININMNEEPGLYQDIYRYAEVKTAALTCLSTEQNLTQADLTEQLCSYANGMFLWVALVIHRSPHLESLSGVLQAVHSVPSHIESMYQQALQSIPSNTFEVARRVFLWLIAACRPLKPSELTEAITVDDTHMAASVGCRNRGRTNLYPDANIVRICGGLVIVSEDGFVRFIHSSVRKYLLSQHAGNPPTCSLSSAHELIARRCFLFFRSKEGMCSFPLPGHQMSTQTTEARHDSPISSYATTYWSVHYRLAEPYSKSLVGTLQQLLSIELSNPHGSLGLGGKATSASVNQTALRISSGYGFTALVKLYLEMGVGPDGAPCASCETPLQLAAACGRTEIVALLLNSGASVGSQGPPHGETPLYLAAASGFAHTVTLLLEHGADPEATSAGSSWTPLHVAAAHGHLEVMHSFLNSNIDINSVTTATNETPLHLAAHQGHFHVVKYLLNSHRVSLTEREFYESIVQKSYFRTWSEEVLLDLRNDRGFVWEVNARCSAEEDLGKLRSLAKGYADVNIPTSDGRTALHYAASNGHEAVVRLLLERGADPEGGGLSHHTALRAAAENGHLPIVRLLLIHTSNMAVRCKDWRTILEHSAETGHQAIADLLLWQAFGLEIAGQGFRSAMLNVVGKSKQNIVQGILQRTRPDHSL